MILKVIFKVAYLLILLIFTVKLYFESIKKVYRLGNEIDLWFTQNNKYQLMLKDSKVSGFVEYLRNNKPRTNKIKIKNFNIDGFISYDYKKIIKYRKEFSDELQYSINNYFGSRVKKNYIPGECVIHYRLGDFLNDENYGTEYITPEQICKQVLELKPRPKSILLLTGSIKHQGFFTKNSKKYNLIKKSNNIILKLQKLLVESGFKISYSNNSPDDDFLKMVYADYLITGLGSFCITAAMNNKHGIIRTPGLDKLIPNIIIFGVKKHTIKKIKKLKISDNWYTYEL